MKRRILRMTIVLSGVILLATSGVHGQTPPALQSLPLRESTNRNRAARVWTNEDVASLRESAAISIVGSMPDESPQKTKVAARLSTKQDAAWYRERLAGLEAERSRIDGQIDGLKKYRSITAYMVGGIIVPQLAGLPLNPEDQIRQLNERRREVTQDIEALHDLARRNEILPGDIR